jgi:hypothetical protein
MILADESSSGRIKNMLLFFTFVYSFLFFFFTGFSVDNLDQRRLCISDRWRNKEREASPPRGS